MKYRYIFKFTSEKYEDIKLRFTYEPRSSLKEPKMLAYYKLKEKRNVTLKTAKDNYSVSYKRLEFSETNWDNIEEVTDHLDNSEYVSSYNIISPLQGRYEPPKYRVYSKNIKKFVRSFSSEYPSLKIETNEHKQNNLYIYMSPIEECKKNKKKTIDF